MLKQLDSGTLTLLYLMPLRLAHAGEHQTGWINVSVFFFFFLGTFPLLL